VLKNANKHINNYFLTSYFSSIKHSKMKVLYIFSIVIISLTFSCKKKGKADFTLKGVVTDGTFSTPLTSADVFLYETIAGESASSLIGQTTTNSIGEYAFTFARNSAESYYITTTKADYFPLEETIYFSELTIDNDNVRNFTTTALSWVRLRFINNSPSATDVFQYNRQKGKINCASCCSAGVNYLYGAIDTSIYCVNDGNTIYQYQYSLQGTTNNGIKSTTTVAFDTTEIFLSY
jgi:hypothetical protein